MHRLLALCILLSPVLPAAERLDSYLIVPFHNASGAANLDWIGESIAETVREALASFDVAAIRRQVREEAARDLSIRTNGKLTKASLIRLGQETGASRVVYGRFNYLPPGGEASLAGGALEISAHSIDLRRAALGPEWRESGLLAGLSQLQTRLSWRVLRYAEPHASPSEREYFEDRPPIRIDATENYVRGLLARDLEDKHRFLALAVNLEPGFSQASFQLGRLQWEDNSYRAAGKWLERVKPADAHYLEANFLLGLCRYHTGNYPGAQAAFELVARSAALAPVHNNLGLTLYRLGAEGALENILWALERDPSDPDLHFNAGYILWRQGDADAAAGYFRAALELDPLDMDAGQVLERCLNGAGPRKGDLSGEGLERLKEAFEEAKNPALVGEE